MATEAAVAASAAAAVAAGAFDYNRENFLWDQENRWERFTSAREYANQQAEQFRGDVRAMAALTAKKCTIWAIMATLTCALCVALYCAGRLGLHGPSPPAWIMGLWLTNNAAAFAFMILTVFLSMHAAFRAQAASTQLLTRKIRVPVPSLAELDTARRFASEFEQQNLRDIFRVPLVTNNGAPRTDDDIIAADGSKPGGDASGRSKSAPPRGRDCSSWIREEFAEDRAPREGQEGAPLPEDTQPDHFRLIEAVQKEYYEHDIYARVAIFYGFIHYVQSLGFYGLGHVIIELRAFWTAFGCVFVIAVLQALLLRFDIMPQSKKNQKLKYCEYLGPLAILVAGAGMAIDFRVEFNTDAIAIGWIVIFTAYVMQLLYSLRMLELVLPDDAFVLNQERLGDTWLPEGWRKIPSAFYHVWYFVAPPKKLQPGQYDLVREVRDGGVGIYDDVLDETDNGKPRELEKIEGPLFANSTSVRPWRLVARIVAVMPVSWVFLIGGTAVDLILGEQALVTAPHWSRPPLTRQSLDPHEIGTPLGFAFPAGAEPFLPEQMAWHEEKRHAGSFHVGRRLQEERPEGKLAFPDALKNLVAAISSADKVAAAQTQADAERISWPGFFEPKLMACGQDTDVVAALTPRGFGAVTNIAQNGDKVAEPFKLGGLTHLPALLGASWGLQSGDGLLTISRSGHLASCPGPHPDAGGVWMCSDSLPQLPVADGTRIQAASAAWLGRSGPFERRLHAAMVVDSAPDLVGLFVHEAGSWLPLGEVRVPGDGSAKTSLSFVGNSDLVVATEDHILRRNLVTGQVISSATNAHAKGGVSKSWQASCSLPASVGRVAHLHLKQAPSSRAWRPELVSVKLA